MYHYFTKKYMVYLSLSGLVWSSIFWSCHLLTQTLEHCLTDCQTWITVREHQAEPQSSEALFMYFVCLINNITWLKYTAHPKDVLVAQPQTYTPVQSTKFGWISSPFSYWDYVEIRKTFIIRIFREKNSIFILFTKSAICTLSA